MRLVGVDHSLTSTGVAFVAAGEVQALWTITTPAPPATADPLEARMDRIAFVARRFSDHLDEVAEHPARGPLVLVIETRDWQARGSGHPVDRAGLWVQLMTTARVYGAVLVGVAPTTLKVYACGNGRASKYEVKEAVERAYGVRCRNDDEADALTLAAMGADHYGCPLGGEPAPEYRRRTIGRPAWPRV